MTLQELRHKVMRPATARNEQEVAQKVEDLSEAEQELARVDPGYKELPDEWKLAAFRGILTGKIKEHIDLKIAESEVGFAEIY
eukprot:4226504-Alexandrium_andersonii.AAC.1